MTTLPSCLCGSRELRRIRIPSFGERKLYQCTWCRTVQLFPLPRFEVSLDDIYQSASYLGKITRTEYYGYYKVFEEYIRQDLSLPNDIALLDFGAGHCYYQRFFLDEGYREVHSLEINPHMVRHAREKLGLDHVFRAADQLPRTHYDIVIANQVFEHLANPLSTLVEVIGPVLKPNGFVCFSVPNWESLNRPLLQKRWLGYAPEDHIWFFSARSIQFLFARSTHYDIVDIRVRSAVGKRYDGFRPKGFVKQFYYKSFMRLSELVGRGDQLIVTLRKKSPASSV